MSQPSAFSARSIAPFRCLIGEAKTEEAHPQICQRVDLRVANDKRVARDQIIKRKRLFQMGPGLRKLADKHQICTKGAVTQNKRGRSVALIAPTQQVLGRALRQIEFATQPMIARLPIERLNELWGRSQPFP